MCSGSGTRGKSGGRLMSVGGDVGRMLRSVIDGDGCCAIQRSCRGAT